ncbi:hypothetical protein [Micromonospora sp. WMMD710]|uniref:hypothetical protein n=1 Tax=Micromonospora sp. WMMD710 TaxID=3016085 RepID=UPI002415F314|nr:hypothetical protein [Micromonospora sp. WMMD710]MDG4758137.1 hypothetical protein [Micromonospora sp. WMMD710]
MHDEAPSAAATDWAQITALYEVLLGLSDNPVVSLNHAVAVAMSRGAPAGLALLADLADDPRLPAARAHLWELVGERVAAREAYRMAASRSTNLAQQRYLNARADRLADDPPDAG